MHQEAIVLFVTCHSFSSFPSPPSFPTSTPSTSASYTPFTFFPPLQAKDQNTANATTKVTSIDSMTKLSWFVPSSRQIQLSLWAWVSILLHFSSFVYSLESLALKTDQPPRAALVTLAHENDLPGMLYSIRQLEDKFNSRYQYHWVFFSPRELSEEFKRATSNATNATCIYEVISDEHWSVPNWIDRRRFHPTDDSNLNHGYNCAGTDADLRKIYRWNSGPFAREKRLKYYDWFLRVEPGVS